MSQLCRIVVTTGPDRGKVFEPDEELVHIGRAPENQIVLEDPGLGDHQATILSKNGRFAIYRPDESVVEVDGSSVPAEQWVWLPIEARLQFGRRTSCQFSYEPVSGEDSPSTVPEPDSTSAGPGSNGKSTRKSGETSMPSVKAPPLPKAVARESEDGASDPEATKTRRSDRKKSEKKKKKKRSKQVARFITDQGGPMVELGADGHLPELALQDGPAAKAKREKPATSNPIVLYFLLGLSMLSSLAMLFVEPSSGVSETTRAEARQELVRFFGIDENEIAEKEREIKRDPKARWPWPSNKKPIPLMGSDGGPAEWQKDLRAARVARTRGDTEAERTAYRRVLNQLNAEDHDMHFGMTGHVDTDGRLKELVSIAISR